MKIIANKVQASKTVFGHLKCSARNGAESNRDSRPIRSERSPVRDGLWPRGLPLVASFKWR